MDGSGKDRNSAENRSRDGALLADATDCVVHRVCADQQSRSDDSGFARFAGGFARRRASGRAGVQAHRRTGAVLFGCAAGRAAEPAANSGGVQAPDKPAAHAPEVAMAADEGGDISVPDFSGKTMREVTEMCLHLGLEPLLVGSNLAIEQRPEAGTQVRRGAKVTVQFGTPPPAKLAKAHARSRR